MSETRLIFFMYHHYQHCFISKEKPMPPPSSSIFTLFPRLPTELRLKIWDAVAEEPNNVELSCTPTASYLPDGRWFSHSKPPVLFRICSESRAVAMAHYDVLTFSPDMVGIPYKGNLYINFAVDTLWVCADMHIKWARMLLSKNDQLKEKLKYLAVNEKIWKDLNQTDLTPRYSGGVLPWLPPAAAIVCELKALEDVRFHS
jgi:2EXR family